MNGILAVNHFLNSNKFNELHRHIIKAADNMGINLSLMTNLQLATKNYYESGLNDCDFVLFWDKDVNLAKRLEAEGALVFNSADAIDLCDDKAKTYIALKDIVKQPKTLIAPKTYFMTDMSEFVREAVKILRLPLVFKECFGSFGEQVYLCNSFEEIMEHITEKPFILQEFIKESAGSDIRIEVVNGRCISAVKRNNDSDFRSNVTNGGTMTPYSPCESEQKTAVISCERLGLTFGGVDILSNGMVCEVNSNAHIINIMKTNGIDIMPYIFSAISDLTGKRKSNTP